MDPSHFSPRFIVGMHRSGTSVVAALLEGMGLSVGKSVMSPAPDNPLGFYENAAVVDFHDRLLEEQNSTWHDPRPFGKRLRSVGAEQMAAWRKEIARILAGEFAPGRHHLLKDPRLCRLLPLWEPFIADSGFPIVMVLRHPASVAASLSARNGFSADKALMLWLANNLEMERESRAFQRELVTYSDLLRNPTSVCRRLQQRLELPDCDLDGLVRARLRQDLSHQNETWPTALPKLRDWCQTVFEILQHSDPEPSTLDGIFQDYAEWIGSLPDDFSGLAETRLRRELARIPPAPKLHAEIFADHGEGFSESASVRRDIVALEWQTIRIEHLERLQTDPTRRLRMDPMNQRGFVTLSRIRIFRERDGADLYLADSEEAFGKIAFSLGLQPYFQHTGLVLVATDPDPQMLLPVFAPLGQDAFTLEMTFKVELASEPLCQRFCELQEVRVEHARLLGAHEELQGERKNLVAEVGELRSVVESAQQWQRRSWFKRAFHRWRPPAEKEP
ncbi:MAG: sulfotransferase [Chthoniobacteraceae bacterium]